MSNSRERDAIRLVAGVLLWATLASPSVADPWKFIATGDSRGTDNGVNTTILGELATEIVNQSVDLVIFPGDLVTGGVDQATLESQLLTWRDIMQPVYDAGIGVYPVRGNHDLGSPAGVTAWNNVFSGPYGLPQNGPAGEENLTFAVEHENALFLGLDQYVTPHRVNQTWVDEQLAASGAPHVFSFGHEPAFEVEHTDCLDDYPTRRDAFWHSLEDAGGRTCFAGHDHFCDHARVDDDGDPGNDIHQLVVGTAGAPLYSWSGSYDGDNGDYTLENLRHARAYGCVLGEIDGLTATLTWMRRVGVNTFEPREQWSYTIPEPATLGLFAIAAALLQGRSRRRREILRT
ncbi:MAG: metallophosphoesterase [Planctomycetes bacterium]|nr:metallophosphoesterase [Planctomycetota bacterium]